MVNVRQAYFSFSIFGYVRTTMRIPSLQNTAGRVRCSNIKLTAINDTHGIGIRTNERRSRGTDRASQTELARDEGTNKRTNEMRAWLSSKAGRSDPSLDRAELSGSPRRLTDW